MIELALVIILSISFINASGYLTNKDQLQDYYISRDVAQIINSIESIPYDIDYNYGQSFDGVTISIKGNDVRVVSSNDNSKIRTTYADAFFEPSNYLKTPDDISFSGADFSFLKTNNNLLIGQKPFDNEQEILENNQKTESISKDDLKIKIALSYNYVNEELLLKEINNTLTDLLSQDGFVVVSKGENTVLKLSFEDNVENSIYYSSNKKSLTKPLSTNLWKLLKSQISILEPIEDADTQYDQPTITLVLSSSEDSFDKFSENKPQDKGFKLFFTKRIEMAFKQTFT